MLKKCFPLPIRVDSCPSVVIIALFLLKLDTEQDRAQTAFGNWVRYSVGDCPTIFLKMRLKWVRDWKPTS